MASIGLLLLEVKRAEKPAFRKVKNILGWILKTNLQVPRVLKPTGRLFYHLRLFTPMVWRRVKTFVWSYPLFACRCEEIGKGVIIQDLPVVSGHTSLFLGNNVRFSGAFSVHSGRFC